MGRRLASRMMDTDEGFVATVAALTMRPGQVTRTYLAGGRRRYSGPLRYVLIVVTIYAIVFNTLGVEFEVPGLPERDEVDRLATRVVHALLAYMAVPVLLLVALLQWPLFRSAGLSLAETWVVALYAFGHATWLSTLSAISGLGELAYGVVALAVLQAGCVAWALTDTYQRGAVATTWRAILLFAVYVVLLNAVALVVAQALFQAGWLELLDEALAWLPGNPAPLV